MCPLLRKRYAPTLLYPLSIASPCTPSHTPKPPLLQACQSNADAEEPPDLFICPISQEVMKNPVFAADG